ncbi:MAG TPA: DsrE family protein, partial [Gammaproteobacteria bacterium]
VLAIAAFEQRVTVLFLDDGVYQLVKEQRTDGLGIKDFSPTYKALEMCEVERVVVDADSLKRRGISIDDLIIPVELVEGQQVGELFENHDIRLNF